ncbi:MAG TPA: immune inhibitor A [Anaerolineae bacterium]|nr:immune inhibitor A [Anaerolineae bacterium]
MRCSTTRRTASPGSTTTSDYDPNAYPTVKTNVPGLTGSTGGAWVNMSFSLSACAGQNILIAFRYVTDWATTEAGWFIDDVKVDDTLISDGSSVAPFRSLTEIVPINNNFVGFKGNGKGNQYKVLTLKLNDVTEEGLFELNEVLKASDRAAMLVTFAAPQGLNQYVDYGYEFGYKSAGPKKVGPKAKK